MIESKKAASDDEKSADKHDLFLKSLSASINSYSLKEASIPSSVPSSADASPKKKKKSRIPDVIIESSSEELSNTPHFHRKSFSKTNDLLESSSSEEPDSDESD